MKILKRIVASVFVGLVAGKLGDILIEHAFDIKESNPFWWIALVGGVSFYFYSPKIEN